MNTTTLKEWPWSVENGGIWCAASKVNSTNVSSILRPKASSRLTDGTVSYQTNDCNLFTKFVHVYYITSLLSGQSPNKFNWL
jgi:hypothetical protein